MKKVKQERTGTAAGRWDEAKHLGIKGCTRTEKPEENVGPEQQRSLVKTKRGSNPEAKTDGKSFAWGEDAKNKTAWGFHPWKKFGCGYWLQD